MTAPDWNYWLNRSTVPIETACALSVNIEPRAVKLADHATLAEYERRCSLAYDAVRAHKLPASTRTTDALGFESHEVVTLADFRAWRDALPAPFELPPQFPETTPKPAVAPARELTTTERETLLELIGVLCELSGFDLRTDTKGFAEAKKLKKHLEHRHVQLTEQTVAGKIASARELIAPKGPTRLEFK